MKPLNRMEVTEDRQILHPSNTRGTVISRVQTIRDHETGVDHKAYFWNNWSHPDCPLVRVTDSMAFNA